MEINILYAAITILAGFTIAGIVHVLIGWLTRKAEQTETKIDDIILMALGKPLVVTIMAVSVYISVVVFNLIPPSFGWLASDMVISSFFILIEAWVVSVFAYNLIHTYGSWIAARTDTDFDDRLVPMLEIVAKYVIWFVAFMLILTEFKIDITPFLAGAGIAGIALALAAQDLIGNFFGGAVITIDKPFRKGDRIKIDDNIGDVVEIGPRSTRIRTLDNMVITIPNQKITQSVVTNYAMPDLKQKIRIPFSIAYGTSIKKAKGVLLEIAGEAAKKTPWVLADPEPKVYILEFGDSSLNGKLVVWTNNYDAVWDVQDWINERIEERFEEEGIEIPFPQVEIRMREQK